MRQTGAEVILQLHPSLLCAHALAFWWTRSEAALETEVTVKFYPEQSVFFTFVGLYSFLSKTSMSLKHVFQMSVSKLGQILNVSWLTFCN